MKILFFSVTKHQLKYFLTLQKHLKINAEQFFFPTYFFSLQYWNLYKKLNIDEILKIKAQEIEIKYSNSIYKWMYLKFLKMQIPWLVSSLYLKLMNMQPDFIVLWNGKKFHQALALQVAEQLHIKAIFFENGVLPNTTTMDFQGVNASSSLPKEIEFYKKLNFSEKQMLPQQLVTRESKTKKKVFTTSLPKKYIFVPFQVAYDTQIIQHSPWISDMFVFYKILEWLSSRIDIPFVIKEHPSDRVSNYTKLYQRTNKNIYFSSEDTQVLIENADIVLSINSSVVMESLLFSKKVIVLGEAFFAIDGIVKTAHSKEEILVLLQNIDNWNLDTALIQKFLKYIYFYYLIPDSWKNPTNNHYMAIEKKLKEHR